MDEEKKKQKSLIDAKINSSSPGTLAIERFKLALALDAGEESLQKYYEDEKREEDDN